MKNLRSLDRCQERYDSQVPEIDDSEEGDKFGEFMDPLDLDEEVWPESDEADDE